MTDDRDLFFLPCCERDFLCLLLMGGVAFWCLDYCGWASAQQLHGLTCSSRCSYADGGFSGCAGRCAGALEETRVKRLAAARVCREGRLCFFILLVFLFVRALFSVC
ncbi:hypothetical protein BCY84_08584 [Trypanosoma cruzi cruzi]|nr:hypothetical protein BCY84_19306 [Trypanosoma cruzi cruzi]PBJ76583.1 hypothetical protein BCY84_08584 [Trypanosoma cruzi cruzi]